MGDDDENEAPTVPPPPGEDDPYDADTKVGQASEDILAIVRAAEDGAKISVPPPAPAAAPEPAPEPEAEPEPAREPPRVERAPVETHSARPIAPEAPSVPTGGGWPPVVSLLVIFALVTAVLAALVR